MQARNRESEKKQTLRKHEESKDFHTKKNKTIYGSVTRLSDVSKRSLLKSILCILSHLFSPRARRPKKCLLEPPKITESYKQGRFAKIALFEN